MKRHYKQIKFVKKNKHCGISSGIENKINSYSFPETMCMLVSKEAGRLTEKQIATIRLFISRNIKKEHDNIEIPFLRASIPLTRKKTGIRMGKGKGGIYDKVCLIKAGRILCSVSFLVDKPEKCYKALLQLRYKLPFKSEVIMDHIKIKNKTKKK